MSGNIKFCGQFRKQSSIPKPGPPTTFAELPVSRPPQASGFRGPQQNFSEVPHEKEAFQYHSPPFQLPSVEGSYPDGP